VRTPSCRVLVTILIAGLMALPAAAQQHALAVLVQAEDAQIDGQAAVTGTNVYAGETLSTGPAGSLRASLGPGHISLRAASSLALQQTDDALQLDLTAGTVAFSLPASSQFQIETPVGTVRAATPSGQTSAEITIASANEIVISAVSGDLEIDRPCENHTIRAGSTYRASLETDSGKSSKCGDNFVSAVNQHIVVKIVAVGVVGVAAILLYNKLCESPSGIK
jgi:hypothetical protein